MSPNKHVEATQCHRLNKKVVKVVKVSSPAVLVVPLPQAHK